MGLLVNERGVGTALHAHRDLNVEVGHRLELTGNRQRPYFDRSEAGATRKLNDDRARLVVIRLDEAQAPAEARRRRWC